MADDSKIVFVDTNAFLQVRDLKDVPWAELFPGANCVDLMVAPVVINECRPLGQYHRMGGGEIRRERFVRHNRMESQWPANAS